MLKRPTSRRKTKNEQIVLNLVPILDTMVTLIGFLLFTMAFMSLVHIESPFPVTSAEESQAMLKERPLQLTVTLKENEVEVWSPFDKFPTKTIPHVNGKPDTAAMHEALIAVKQQFPTETKVVFVPPATANYDTLISMMDAMRTLSASDTPIYRKNPDTGNDEAVKTLFPEVIFGNLLGDA